MPQIEPEYASVVENLSRLLHVAGRTHELVGVLTHAGCTRRKARSGAMAEVISDFLTCADLLEASVDPSAGTMKAAIALLRDMVSDIDKILLKDRRRLSTDAYVPLYHCATSTAS